MSVKLAEVIRGNTVESIHRGDIAVVDANGKLIYEVGNAGRKTFFRSTAKPFQAIWALESGIVEEYGLGLNEIAIMIASHSGEKVHTNTLEGIMKKVGIDEGALKCGIHEPVNRDAAKQLVLEGKLPTRLHCNCSGKHIGLISALRKRGIEKDSYLMEDHIMQEEIRKIISEFCNVAWEDMDIGTDGCGMPIYAVPLKNIALSYANLCDREFAKGKYSKSQNYILSAMTMYPEMIAGKGRLDTEIKPVFKLGKRLEGEKLEPRT